MPLAEIEEIARPKKLTPAQKALLLSVSKEPGKYTDGGTVGEHRNAVPHRTAQPQPRSGHDRAGGKSRSLETDAGAPLLRAGNGFQHDRAHRQSPSRRAVRLNFFHRTHTKRYNERRPPHTSKNG